MAKTFKELEVEKEQAANMANIYRGQVEELKGKRNMDAKEFTKIKKTLTETAHAYVAEKKARITADAIAMAQDEEIKSLRAQLNAAEGLNASYAAKAIRDAESCGSHEDALENSRIANLELDTKLKTAEMEGAKLRMASKELESSLTSKTQELEDAKRENSRLRKSSDAVSAKHQKENESLMGVNHRLIKDLGRESKAREENHNRWQTSEDKLKLCLYCLEFLAPVRRRWMLFPLQTREYEIQMEAGNRAAHWPKLLVDIGLFSLGIFKEADKAHFERMYKFEMQDFVGSYATLQPLIQIPEFVELIEMRGAMIAFFGLGGTLSIPTVDENFLELERECKKVLDDLEKTHGSKRKARVAYATSPATKVEHRKMQALVRQMHVLHKTRHNRQQDPS